MLTAQTSNLKTPEWRAWSQSGLAADICQAPDAADASQGTSFYADIVSVPDMTATGHMAVELSNDELSATGHLTMELANDEPMFCEGCQHDVVSDEPSNYTDEASTEASPDFSSFCMQLNGFLNQLTSTLTKMCHEQKANKRDHKKMMKTLLKIQKVLKPSSDTETQTMPHQSQGRTVFKMSVRLTPAATHVQHVDPNNATRSARSEDPMIRLEIPASGS